MNKTKEFFNKAAVVSYSGGMDSTCLVMDLLSRGYRVFAYSFDYGQAHSVELHQAEDNVRYMHDVLELPVEHQVINLRDAFSGDTSTLVQHTKSPEGDYREESMKSTVVNNRNVIFSAVIFAKALSLAKRILGEEEYDAAIKGEEVSKKELRRRSTVVISLGVHAGDHTIYPDCTEESVKLARRLYKISNWDSDLVTYETPFVHSTKAEVLARGISAMHSMDLTDHEVNEVLRRTISCYNATPDGVSCGKCGTCTERLEAFAANGLKDPAPYANN